VLFFNHTYFLRASPLSSPLSYPSKQVICISGGNGEVRAPKALDYRRIYTNDLTVFVKQRAAGTAECRRGIMNDLVLKYAPYV
jgi:hypothetical protein